MHALAQPGKKIAIVGGGFLGSELAAALISKKCEVVQVFPEEGNVAHVLPKYLSKWTSRRLEAGGVSILPGQEIISLEKDSSQVRLNINNNQSIVAVNFINPRIMLLLQLE